MGSLFLGFCGRARHGKTEATESIVKYMRQWDLPTVGVYDIGDAVRRWCIEHGRLPEVARADMTSDQLQILINVGKEKRAVDVNFWIGQMLQRIDYDDFDVAICPNIRYPNEVEAVRSFTGGTIIRCTRYNSDGSIYISPDRPPNDSSETCTEMILADYYLASREGEQDWMQAQAIALYEYLWEKVNRD